MKRSDSMFFQGVALTRLMAPLPLSTDQMYSDHPQRYCNENKEDTDYPPLQGHLLIQEYYGHFENQKQLLYLDTKMLNIYVRILCHSA